MNIDTLLECRWVIPVRPFGVALADHAIAVHQGRIVAVLPIEQARSAYVPDQRVSLAQHAVLPGFVNTHAHAAMALMRGIGDDLPLMDWLRTRIWPLEQALATESFVYDGSRLAAAEMLRAGTTTVSDMYFFPEAAARALRAMGMRAVVGIITIEIPTAYASDADDYLHKGLATRETLRDDPLVSFTLAPHAPYTVADPTLARIATLAEELDLPVHIHLHETAAEIEDGLQRDGVRPLQRLARLGLLSPRLIAVHAVHLTDAEIAQLARHGASVVHCPASNLKLGSGIARVRELLAAGVNVAIGTDGAASNNRLDPLADARLASLLAKGISGDAAVLPAARTLECLTLNGARALGLEARIGSIEPGKDADLVALDLNTPETCPLFDPISHIVYAAGREHVTDVWVAGNRVVQKRQIIVQDGNVPSSEIFSLAAPWQNRMQQFLNIKPDV